MKICGRGTTVIGVQPDAPAVRPYHCRTTVFGVQLDAVARRPYL